MRADFEEFDAEYPALTHAVHRGRSSRKHSLGTFAGTHLAHKRYWARAGKQRIHSGRLYVERHEMCGICGEIVFDGSSAGRCIAAMLAR